MEPSTKGKSKKWSQREVDQLMSGIDEADCAPEDLNWGLIAERVEGRTGKQCREKYKNDLRPDLSKQPWSAREEYTLARAHCVIGNQWAEITRFLPGRSENTIKNKWNATLRARADAKSHMLLWGYAQKWQAEGRQISMDLFERAVADFSRQNGQAVLESIKVPEAYFQGEGLNRQARHSGATSGSSYTRSGSRAGSARPVVRRSKPKRNNKKRARSTYGSKEDEEDDWSGSEYEEARPSVKRASIRAFQQQQQQAEQEELELSRMPPPSCIPFPLPAIHPPVPQGHLPFLASHPQQPQPPLQQPPSAPPPPFTDVTNLLQLSHMEPSATIKLCVPKHAHGSLKGFSFLSDLGLVPAAGNQENQQPADSGKQQPEHNMHRSESGVAAPLVFEALPQQHQQAAALPTPTPSAKYNLHNTHMSSPVALGPGKLGVQNAAHTPLLSPAMPQDVDYLTYLRELGLESTADYNHSPATMPLLKLLESSRRDSSYGTGDYGAFGGSTCKTLPLFSRRDSMLFGSTARRDSMLFGGRNDSLGGAAPCQPSNQPSWLSRPPAVPFGDHQPLIDPPFTQPQTQQAQPPLLDPPLTQPQPTNLQHQPQIASPLLQNAQPQPVQPQVPSPRTHHTQPPALQQKPQAQPVLGHPLQVQQQCASPLVKEQRQLLQQFTSPISREQDRQLVHQQCTSPVTAELTQQHSPPFTRERILQHLLRQQHQAPDLGHLQLEQQPHAAPDVTHALQQQQQQVRCDVGCSLQQQQQVRCDVGYFLQQQQRQVQNESQLGQQQWQLHLLQQHPELLLSALRQQQQPHHAPDDPAHPTLHGLQQQHPDLLLSALHGLQQQYLSQQQHNQALSHLHHTPLQHQQPKQLGLHHTPVHQLHCVTSPRRDVRTKHTSSTTMADDSSARFLTPQLAAAAAASPRLNVNSPTCGFVSGCFL